MLFYPKNAQVPEKLSTQEFYIRPLRTIDVEMDYSAVMSSKEMLRQWSQSDWPSDDFTITDNLIDLQKPRGGTFRAKSFHLYCTRFESD